MLSPTRLVTLLLATLAGMALPAAGQDRIYRCGNEYTNSPTEAQKSGCRLLSGGNVTVVPAQRPVASPPRPPASGPRVNNTEQRQRDADARLILEEELRKAEARRAELHKEYNNGEPERLGPETRNHQKYLDRVAGLKAQIERVEADITGIRRELDRLPAPTR